MDPSEIVKHAPEILKGAATVAGAIKFSDVVKSILGPAASEIGERLRDDIRIYRFGRQLSLLEKAEKMASKAGFKPKAVPIKLLFPLLEAASLEENDELHTKWAALLANASDGAGSVEIRPCFIDILRQLTPLEAKLISDAYDASARVKNISMIDPRQQFLIFCYPAETIAPSDGNLRTDQSKSIPSPSSSFLPLRKANAAASDDADEAIWEDRSTPFHLLNEALARFDDSEESERESPIQRRSHIAL